MTGCLDWDSSHDLLLLKLVDVDDIDGRDASDVGREDLSLSADVRVSRRLGAVDLALAESLCCA
jgi:hypothetical protein